MSPTHFSHLYFISARSRESSPRKIQNTTQFSAQSDIFWLHTKKRPSVAVTLVRPLHVSNDSQSKEKGKTKQATLISDFHAHGSRNSLWPIRLARNYIYDVTIHPSRGLRINPTLKMCEHNWVAHASMAPDKGPGRKAISPSQ